MTPRTVETIDINFKVGEQSSKTYELHTDKNIVSGFVDTLEAVKQAVYLILSVERYKHIIYSWNYGIELLDLYGKPIPFVLSEIPRRITEALSQDTRVTGVDDFSFDVQKGKIGVTFEVQTIFGKFEANKEVVY